MRPIYTQADISNVKWAMGKNHWRTYAHLQLREQNSSLLQVSGDEDFLELLVQLHNLWGCHSSQSRAEYMSEDGREGVESNKLTKSRKRGLREAPTTRVGRVTPSTSATREFGACAHPLFPPIHSRPPIFSLNNMETIDITRLKSGEVNLGVRSGHAVGSRESGTDISPGI